MPEILRQVSFNGGELDPRMRARRDTKTYYNMIELGQNLVTTPAGTLEGRPGLTFVDYVRHRMAQVTVGAGMLGAPSGGTAADLAFLNGAIFQTATDLGSTPQVLITIDFGAPVRVGAIDIIDYVVKDAAAAVVPEPPPFQYPYEPPVFEGPIFYGGGGIIL